MKKFKVYTAKKNLPDAPALIERVLARLHELKYIDDDRILQNYFEYKLAFKPVGKYRFLNDMRRIGIPKVKAINAWESKNVDEEALALQLLEARKKRFVGLKGQDRKKKIVSLLGGRGFAPDVIWKVLEMPFIRDMKGILKGIDTTIDRGEDRL